jgi:hypothetical protein
LFRLPFLIHVAGKVRWYCKLSGHIGGLIKLMNDFIKKNAENTEKANIIRLLFIKGFMSGFSNLRFLGGKQDR